MLSRLFFATLSIAMMIGAVLYPVPGSSRSGVPWKPAVEAVSQCQVPCSPTIEVVDIKASTDPATRRRQRQVIKTALEKGCTIVRLGPDVDLDFSDLPPDFFPIYFGPCATLTSVSAFTDVVHPRRSAETSRRDTAGRVAALGARTPAGSAVTTEARTPRSRGPVLRFGKHGGKALTFFAIRSFVNNLPNDAARISGFRLYGPGFGQQSTDEVGIRIMRSVDIEISNMEIAGWGGSGIAVEDDPGPDHPSNTIGPGGRITNPGQVRIHNNFFHHNQHPKEGSHAQGYGVDVNHGAWAQISRNVFDFNRHAISAAGDSGGYAAEQNLVLKGGGYHGAIFNTYTHSFDVHGTGCYWSSDLCGDAGTRFSYIANAFQYRKDNAIKIRGKPLSGIYIADNIFPHPGLEDDWGEDAIYLQTGKNITIGPGNVINYDSFGKYGVGDFDGDGVDDLFLATGATWWFSSFGEFHWSYLNAKTERINQVRLGYFDNDLRCDVLAEQDGQWVISSGGTGNWQSLGAFGAPLSEVQFGRFDPNQRDHRPGVTRRTTHAFRRAPNGQWFVTPLSKPDWKPVQSSSLQMNQLRFGDFNGDGVTDVLAVDGGHWAISESASSPWRRLNASLGDGVGSLFIANMDRDDNIDDILRLEQQTVSIARERLGRIILTWWRSRNGIEPWQLWKKYVFEFDPLSGLAPPVFGFVGRFGAAPGGATLAIDPDRLGHFYSKAEIAAGAAPDWTSLFPY